MDDLRIIVDHICMLCILYNPLAHSLNLLALTFNNSRFIDVFSTDKSH